jgi:hypothetical protein
MTIENLFDELVYLLFNTKSKVIHINGDTVDRNDTPYICHFKSMKSRYLQPQHILYWIKIADRLVANPDRFIEIKDKLFELHLKVLQFESIQQPILETIYENE